jgi:hypothetical protein
MNVILISVIKHPIFTRPLFCASIVFLVLNISAQVSFTGSYSQNFNIMGTGSTLPAGWSHIGKLGGSAASWSSTIPSSGSPSAASAGTVNNSLIVATNNFTGTSNTRAFNYSDASSSNRALGTSPTSGAGNILQLILANSTGSAVSSVQLSYNVRRFAAASSPETIPGYRLFVSTNNGISWTAVSAFSATSAVFPNTVGISTYNHSLALPSTVQANGQIRFRWVDDNSANSTVDQRIGLDDVSISLPALTCGVPSAPLVTGITTTSAELSWQPVSNALSYNVRWKESSAASFTNVSGITTPNYSLSGLNASTNYEFQVQAVCPLGTGAFSPVFFFTSSSTNPVCPASTNLNASNITVNSALLSWTSGPGVDYIIIYWKPVGAPNYFSQNNVQFSTWQLTGLSPGTSYVFQIQAICGGFVDEPAINADLSAPFYFTTASAMSTQDEQPRELRNRSITVWPNPINDATLHVRMENLDASITIANVEVIDMLGKRLMQQSFPVTKGVIIGDVELPSDADKGIYLLSITVGADQFTQRLLVE